MPELPEVETMVRGLRPALEGRTHRDARRSTTRSCSRGARRRRSSAGWAGPSVRRVGRRGKWVVIELGDDRGIIVIQPRMTGGFWLVPPDRPEHIRVTFGLGEPGGIGLVLRRPTAGQGRLVSPATRRPRRPSPGRTGRTPWRSRRDDLADRLAQDRAGGSSRP